MARPSLRMFASIAFAFVLLSTFSTPTEAGVIDRLIQRQTCPTCILGGNPITKLVKSFFNQEHQSKKSCRWEQTHGLPEDLGGSKKPSFDHLIRVNYDENANTCSVETNNRVEAMGDQLFCVAGGCEVTEITDTKATVRWGGCIQKDTVTIVPGQNLGDRECVTAEGVVEFARFHNSEDCSGSRVISKSVGGRDPADFSPNDGSGMFWGGIVTSCSTVQ